MYIVSALGGKVKVHSSSPITDSHNPSWILTFEGDNCIIAAQVNQQNRATYLTRDKRVWYTLQLVKFAPTHNHKEGEGEYIVLEHTHTYTYRRQCYKPFSLLVEHENILMSVYCVFINSTLDEITENKPTCGWLLS